MTSTDTTAGPEYGHPAGSRGYREATAALFAAGMATFMTLYYTQGLLPVLSAEYSVSPAVSALTVSATTALLALAIVPASALSERFGRVRVMIVSAVAATIVGLLLPWSPSFEVLLAGRAAGGAVRRSTCCGDGVSGRGDRWALGGQSNGRVRSGDLVRWTHRPTHAHTLPGHHHLDLGFSGRYSRGRRLCRGVRLEDSASVNFTPHRIAFRLQLRQLRMHLRDRTLLALFAVGFLLMGSFITIYNFLGYRLLSAPFSLPPSLVALVFLLYLGGTASSVLAGRCGDRFGRGRVLLVSIFIMGAGLPVTVSDSLVSVLIGVALCTVGFFAAHSIASGWVSARPVRNRSGASASTFLRTTSVARSWADSVDCSSPCTAGMVSSCTYRHFSLSLWFSQERYCAPDLVEPDRTNRTRSSAIPMNEAPGERDALARLLFLPPTVQERIPSYREEIRVHHRCVRAESERLDQRPRSSIRGEQRR